MCGIVGYIGNNQAAPFLLDGMSKLEYRGYDSAGIAVYEKGKITVEKCVDVRPTVILIRTLMPAGSLLLCIMVLLKIIWF